MEEIESFVGPNSEMQLIQTKHLSVEAPMKEAEFVAMGRMRAFCAKILKTLAPPLLREVEKVSALRSVIEPWTPRRSVQISTPGQQAAGKQPRKASAAESVLLKALGITPAELSVDAEALQEFRDLFDSPLRDPHLKVLAAVFGKTMPPRNELLVQSVPEVCVRT
jgi:hypothetical protein